MSPRKPQRLGKGLDALLPTELDEILQTSSPAELKARGIMVEELPVGDVYPNRKQPRKDFNPAALAEMAASMRQHGVLQPLIVMKTNAGYELIAGERRLRAAKLAGLPTVPAIVRSLTEQQQLEVAIIENIQRAELTPLEQAAAYKILHDEFHLTREEIGARVGKAAPTVGNTIRLLLLPDEVKRALAEERINEGHAKAITGVMPDEAAAMHMLSMIIKRNLTVRQAEEMARDHHAGKPLDEKKIVEGSEREQSIISQLGNLFHTKVQINKTAHGGRLVVHFSSEEELEQIARRIIE